MRPSYLPVGWIDVFELGAITPVFAVLERLPVGLPGAALPGPLLLLPPIVPIWFADVPWLSALYVFG
jgi:hypothetical protein